MTVSPQYGGGGRSFVERFVVTEELLRAGAPVACHWLADRQIAPVLSRHGSERLRDEFLPGICRGETYFCLGMSEPDAGSDVAAIRTEARRSPRGWTITGQKVWTTGAREAQCCYLVARTSSEAKRHAGLSEFIVPMDAPGLTVRPIEDLSGSTHFNELFFESVEVPEEHIVGEPGKAFGQIMRQLDYERAGPERFLSTYALFEAMARSADRSQRGELATIGALAARLFVLRTMSLRLAEAMDLGDPPASQAALMKAAGTELEQEIVEAALRMLGKELQTEAAGETSRLVDAVLSAPAFSIRGGTSEILREVVARRALGLREKP